MSNLPPIALVYDNLTTEHGGAEVVLQVLLKLFPEARVYSTVSTLSDKTWLKDRVVHTSFLQHLPVFLRRRHQLQALIAPLAIESLAISEPLVISVTAGPAKGVLTKPNQLHISYLLTPTRYLYKPEDEVLETNTWLHWPGIKALAKISLNYLRWWDGVAANRPDTYVCISHLVARRLQAAYRRTADAIVYPPFISEQPKLPTNVDSLNLPPFLFSLGRHVWYKRVDTLISCALDTDAPTVVAGIGATTQALHTLAGKKGFIRNKSESLATFFARWQPQSQPIAFIGTVTSEEASWLFSQAKVFVMPGVEDFGLTALEALSHGCPVIIHKQSGVAEVLSDKNALFLSDSSAEAIAKAVNAVKGMNFSHTLLKASAMRYSEVEFSKKFNTYIQKIWNHHISQKE